MLFKFDDNKTSIDVQSIYVNVEIQSNKLLHYYHGQLWVLFCMISPCNPIVGSYDRIQHVKVSDLDLVQFYSNIMHEYWVVIYLFTKHVSTYCGLGSQQKEIGRHTTGMTTHSPTPIGHDQTTRGQILDVIDDMTSSWMKHCEKFQKNGLQALGWTIDLFARLRGVVTYECTSCPSNVIETDLCYL